MKHFDIMTLGVPILEFTRMELDKPFSQAGLFYGPVPAGDPGIAMNKVWPYLGSLFVALLCLLLFPWISIGFL